jgi:hypothetical protein
MNRFLFLMMIAVLNCTACSKNKDIKSFSKQIEDGDALPPISKPEVSCVTLPKRIEGNKLYKPQEVCTIEKGAVWLME